MSRKLNMVNIFFSICSGDAEVSFINKFCFLYNVTVSRTFGNNGRVFLISEMVRVIIRFIIF